MKLKPIVLAALACVCAAGCRTTKDVLDDYEKNLSLGNYGGSTPELLELADKRDDSQLLWRLMAAATLHFTNTREADADPAGHAEINALRAAAAALGSWRLEGCTLYVTLEPCCMCAGAAAQARLARIVYGASDPGAGCCGSVYRLSEDPALPWYTPADGGLLAEECRQALLAFKAD